MFTIWYMLFTLAAGFNIRHGLKELKDGNSFGYVWIGSAVVWIVAVLVTYITQLN